MHQESNYMLPINIFYDLFTQFLSPVYNNKTMKKTLAHDMYTSQECGKNKKKLPLNLPVVQVMNLIW